MADYGLTETQAARCRELQQAIRLANLRCNRAMRDLRDARAADYDYLKSIGVEKPELLGVGM